jgi:DNA-binding CsgD family transcriptional regulator
MLRDAVGNPLALVELPAALSTHIGPLSATATLPLTNRLERAFTDRLASLTPEARGLLHVAATDENCSLSELLSAASRLVGRQVALEAATEAGDAALVMIEDQRLLFRHPLMRSAIQQAMSLRERQTAHAALADTLEDNPDRRVWHRAGAELGNSEHLAADLEGAARRAADSGGNAVAFRTMERAARMTEDPKRRGARLIRAAYYAYSLGWLGDMRRLIEGISDLDLVPTDRTELAWLREVLLHDSWSGPMMITSFAEIADRQRAEGEVDRGLQTLLRIAVRCWWSNPDAEARAHMIEVAERFPVQETDADLLAVLALAEPVARGATVMDRLARRWSERDRDNRGAWLSLGMAAFSVGDFVHAERFFEGQIARCRARGYLGALVHGLASQAWTKLHRGDWKHAASLASEAKRLADETGMIVWDTAADLASATVAAYRGEIETANTLAVSGERALLPRSANPMLAMVQLPRGVAALAAGRFDEAYHQLRRIFDPNENAWHPHVRSWALVDLVEAAVHSGHDQEAVGFVKELESVATRSRWPYLQAALEYARPVLAQEADDAAFQAGLRSQCADWPFMRARLQLAYGVWLRRQRRSADARAPLRAARDAFDALGAMPWGERARQELRASGETSRRRSYDLTDALSPQELQIAKLAAAGLSNKEIGQQVFLSHRTVASHLYRTFPKLGITARSHLRAALEGDSTPRRS